MNTKSLSKSVFILLTTISLLGCQQDDHFEIPFETGNEENQALNVLLTEIENGAKTLLSVSQVRSYFVSDAVYTFSSDVVVKGYVVSSDKTGNFYKEFYIQDAPENPTAALHVMIDQVDSYNMFNFGREVYINLNGLHIGESRNGNGIISIGGRTNQEGDEVDDMRALDISEHILRSKTIADITPIKVTFSEINSTHVGMYVAVDNVNFIASEHGKPFVDPNDSFDTQRTMEACEGFGKKTFLLETSSFASYKDLPLPNGTGTIQGIVSKTYNGSDFVLTLNDAADAPLTGADCEPLSLDDFTVAFEDDFLSNNLNKWTSYSVSGSQQWGTVGFGNPAPSAKMSGFSGGARNNEDWLITKAIDLTGFDASTAAYFTFDSVKRYDGNDLEVLYATDYDGGNPTIDGTWTALSPALDNNTSSWDSWTNSGLLSLNNVGGAAVYVAFKYTSDTQSAATFEIDNVKLLVE